LFLKEILPFEDYLFYKPLTQDEVAELEASISNVLPQYYKEFLLHFGIYQDLIYGLFANKESELIDSLGIELIENWVEDVPNFEDMKDYLKDQQISIYTINAKLNDSLISIKKECNQMTNTTVYTFDYTETLSVLRTNSKMALYKSIVEQQFSHSSFNLFGIYNADYKDGIW